MLSTAKMRTICGVLAPDRDLAGVMHDKQGGNIRISRERGDHRDVVVSVNDVRSPGQIVEAVSDDNSGLDQIRSRVAYVRRVDGDLMPTARQPAGKFDRDNFSSAAAQERDIRDQNMHTTPVSPWSSINSPAQQISAPPVGFSFCRCPLAAPCYQMPHRRQVLKQGCSVPRVSLHQIRKDGASAIRLKSHPAEFPDRWSKRR